MSTWKLEWYLTVLHPHIIPPRNHGDDVVPSQGGASHARSSFVGVPSDDVPPPPPLPHGVDDTLRL